MSRRSDAAPLAWPFLGGTAVLIAAPLLATVVLAFTHYDAVGAPRWAGFDNFTRMARDPIFRTALWNSLVFVAMAVPVRLLGAAGVALLTARHRRGAGATRALAYLPSVVPDISYALLWLWLFNPLYGPINLLLDALGLPATAWLLSAWGARAAVAVMTAFQIGEGMLIALAARHDIPGELYELAEIDGASPWWTLRRVTLPLMAPALVLLAARDIVLSFQVNFVPALVLTEGGPFYATTFLPLYVYRNGFEFFRFGYASAMTLVMYALTVGMVGLQWAAARRFRIA